MNKKNILFVLPFMPYPLESGGHQALFNGIRAVKDDFNVFVTYEAFDNSKYRDIEAKFRERMPGVTLLPLLSVDHGEKDRANFYWEIKNFIWGLVLPHKQRSGMTHQYLGDRWINALCPLKEQFSNHINTIIQERSIDIIQVEMPWMIGAVLNIIDKNVKKIFVHHEIAFVRHALEINNIEDTSAIRAYAELSRFVEIELLNRYDVVVTLSETDKQKLIEAGVKTPVVTSFAIVDSDTDYHNPESNRVLSFVGSGKHEPNYLGIKWFLSNCWEKLKREDSKYRLNIIGNWPDNYKSEILEQYEDVDFSGFVDNLGETLKGTIMIVPITVGSGIRMKILEAASNCIPFVSTSIGAEGLPVKDGIHCFIKNNPDEFVAAIFSLQDASICEKHTREAYFMVRDLYSFDALKKNRLTLYKSLCDS